MNEQSKSITDKVPIVNKAFPNDPDYTGEAKMEIVSKCPSCGAPIYGRKELREGEMHPPIRYTCYCRAADKSGLPMQTK